MIHKQVLCPDQSITTPTWCPPRARQHREPRDRAGLQSTPTSPVLIVGTPGRGAVASCCRFPRDGRQRTAAIRNQVAASDSHCSGLAFSSAAQGKVAQAHHPSAAGAVGSGGREKHLGLGQLMSAGRAPGRIRTCDTRFRKPLLYPLSYEGWDNKSPGQRLCVRLHHGTPL